MSSIFHFSEALDYLRGVHVAFVEAVDVGHSRTKSGYGTDWEITATADGLVLASYVFCHWTCSHITSDSSLFSHLLCHYDRQSLLIVSPSQIMYYPVYIEETYISLRTYIFQVWGLCSGLWPAASASDSRFYLSLSSDLLNPHLIWIHIKFWKTLN